jgi:hypothetical protein
LLLFKKHQAGLSLLFLLLINKSEHSC